MDLPPEQFWDKPLDPALIRQSEVIAFPTAALCNSTIQVTISFVAGSGGFHGTVGVDSCWYGPIPIGCSPTSSSVSLGQGQATSLTYTVGSLPNWVSPAYPLDFTFRLSEPGEPDQLTQQGVQGLYLVHATPTVPQVKPWLGVLDDACLWAGGQSTYDGVARELTLGLFFAQRFAYSPIGRYWVGVRGVPSGTFDLSRFFSTPGWVSGDCVDVSCYLAICANALGLNFDVAGYTDSSGNGFDTNLACGIGSDPTQDYTYQSFPFTFHHIAHRAGMEVVYDVACAQKLDLGGSDYRNPPINWTLGGYWQTPFGPWILGLVANPPQSSRVIFIPRWVPDVL